MQENQPTTQETPQNASVDDIMDVSSPATHYTSCCDSRSTIEENANSDPNKTTDSNHATSNVIGGKNSPFNPSISPADNEIPLAPEATHKKVIEETFRFGPYIPILRKNNTFAISLKGIVNYHPNKDNLATAHPEYKEILSSDSIVETPSLCTPLLIKKRTVWPPRVIDHLDSENEPDVEKVDSNQGNNAGIEEQFPGETDDIQLIKVVDKNVSQCKTFLPSSSDKNLEDCIRATTVASITRASRMNRDLSPILSINNYFNSSAANMLIGIGLSRARENELASKFRSISNKLKKQGNDYGDLVKDLEDVQAQLKITRQFNMVYQTDKMLKCPHCPLKTEFAIVMSGHLEEPHQNKKKEYLCNWCDYKIRDFTQLSFHCLAVHKQRCRMPQLDSLYYCQFCAFETRSKRKMNSHNARCEQNFPHDNFLGPRDYGEVDFPGVTSKFITREDCRTYEQTLQDIRLASYNPNLLRLPNQQQSLNDREPIYVYPRNDAQHDSIINNATARLNAARNITPLARNPIGSAGEVLGNSLNTPIVQTSHNMNNSSQLLHLLSQKSSGSNINSLAYPQNESSSFTNGKLVTNTVSNVFMKQKLGKFSVVGDSLSNVRQLMKQNSARNGTGSERNPKNDIRRYMNADANSHSIPQKNSSFVICEICDGYLRDLNQLKTHMQLLHKVKIHQKTLESRPPLNCQKCQWRFFTDQGLERHLLGAHSLVTSNLQEQVDEGRDSGRCTVCGRAHASKLVAHMRDVHKSNLKPAHLSYKCTVCSATFNLYRIFENHVYSVHSDSMTSEPVN